MLKINIYCKIDGLAAKTPRVVGPNFDMKYDVSSSLSPALFLPWKPCFLKFYNCGPKSRLIGGALLLGEENYPSSLLQTFIFGGICEESNTETLLSNVFVLSDHIPI